MIDMEAIFEEYDTICEQESPRTVLPSSSSYICQCGGHKMFNPENMPVCNTCGIIDTHYIDDRPEWLNDTNDDGSKNDNARCGAPKDLQLFSEKWGTGTVINTYKSPHMRRIARINFHSSMNHRDRALFHAYKSIEEAAKGKLSLPDCVIREAKIIYRKFNQEKLTRGAVRTGVKANCVMFACKLNNIPRTTKEIADAFSIHTKDVSRTTELFKAYFSTAIPEQKTVSKVTRPTDVIHRLLNDFNLDDKKSIRIKCMRMAESLTDCVELMGKTPTTVAAVIILKVLFPTFSKKDISECCKVSIPTLNKNEIIINKYLEGK